MKQLFTLLFFLTVLIFSCKKETTPKESSTPSNSDLPALFTKRVLLEDYTKHCQFCVPVNALVDSLRNSYPNRTLIPVLHGAYHSTQTSFYDTMNVYFPFATFPKGMVNRVTGTNSGSEDGNYILSKENWATNIDSELLKTADFGVKINTTLSGNSMDISVFAAGFKSDENTRLTVFIVEDNTYYRTVREVITNNKGYRFALTKDEIREYLFFGVDLSSYSVSKVSIVAFLHYFDATTNKFEVLNVNETKAGNSVDWN